YICNPQKTRAPMKTNSTDAPIKIAMLEDEEATLQHMVAHAPNGVEVLPLPTDGMFPEKEDLQRRWFEFVRTSEADVLLIDVGLYVHEWGLEIARASRQEFPAVPILMFSNFTQPEWVSRAKAHLTEGFILKRDFYAAPEILAEAARRSLEADDRFYLSPGLMELIAQKYLDQGILHDRSREFSLTKAEQELILQYARGCNRDEVIKALNVSPGRHDTMRENLFDRFGLRPPKTEKNPRVSALVAFAVKYKLVDPGF
ncbi:MAG: hypothetical protein AAF570_06210, partial [Bacteroidota bacterium]